MNIDDLQKNFEESSIIVISDLQKKLTKLDEENKHLKLLLEGSVPLIQTQNLDIGISNEKIICLTQIALLKEKAVTAELTLEESRKLQIYVDVLEKVSHKKDDGISANIPPEAELLRLVKDESVK